MNITPDQTRKWRDDARPGPWYVHTDPGDPDGTFIHDEDGHMCIAVAPVGSDYREADLALIAAAPDLAQTIAGMHEEWAKEFRVNDGIWIPEMWHRNRADAERDQYMRWRDHTTTIESRLVHRLVSETEVVEP